MHSTNLQRITGPLDIGQSQRWSLDWTTTITRISTHLYTVRVTAHNMTKDWTGAADFAYDKLIAWIR